MSFLGFDNLPFGLIGISVDVFLLGIAVLSVCQFVSLRECFLGWFCDNLGFVV